MYDGSQWDIIGSSGGGGVQSVDATLPIEVNDDDSSVPIISINAATTTSFGSAQLATQNDVDNSATNRVVTAALLKVVDDRVSAAVAGGVNTVTGTDPIEVDSTTSTDPVISIKDAAVGQKGSIQKFDTTTAIGGPESNTDEATWKAGLDDVGAVTMKAVGASFLLSDFTEYPDV